MNERIFGIAGIEHQLISTTDRRRVAAEQVDRAARVAEVGLVRPGVGFAQLAPRTWVGDLRALLRRDPDVLVFDGLDGVDPDLLLAAAQTGHRCIVVVDADTRHQAQQARQLLSA